MPYINILPFIDDACKYFTERLNVKTVIHCILRSHFRNKTSVTVCYSIIQYIYIYIYEFA